MPDTYVQQRIHLVWATRKRAALLTGECRRALWPYLGGIIRHYGGVLLVAGGIEDHIHVYADYPKTLALSQFVNVIKSNSSRWIRERTDSMLNFHWQSGYGGFSVDRRRDEALHEYIVNQEQHHKTMTFQEEYVRLLRRHSIPYDSRYVFD